jgi:hypothetical protein
MSFNADDLFLVNRNGTSFKTEYTALQNSILSVIERGGCHVGDTAPADPSEGDLWWNPDNQQFRVYVATETDGVVTALGVQRAGDGYSDVTVDTLGGTGVGLTATLTTNFGQIQSAAVANGGHGYTQGDVITIDPTVGFGNGVLIVQTVNTVATGEWQLVNGFVHPEIEIGNPDFDLTRTPFWTCGAIDVPNPTNAEAGMSGLIKVTADPTSWDTNFSTAPTSTVFPSIIPFYVESDTSIRLGQAVGVA